MNLIVDPAWIIAAGLLSLRLAMVMLSTPLDLFGRVPVMIKVVWSIAFALLLVWMLDVQLVAQIDTAIALLMAAIFEVSVGLLLAFGLYTAFGVFNLAGRLLDFQSGFGAANLFDPSSNEQNPLLGTVLMLLATYLFFAAEMHHLLIQGFVFSLQSAPVGSLNILAQPTQIIAQFGSMFVLGVVLVAPIIGILMLVDAGVAIMSKTMPQMNVYFLFLPLKAFLGIGLLALLLPYLRPIMLSAMEGAFEYWARIM